MNTKRVIAARPAKKIQTVFKLPAAEVKTYAATQRMYVTTPAALTTAFLQETTMTNLIVVSKLVQFAARPLNVAQLPSTKVHAASIIYATQAQLAIRSIGS